MPGTASLAKIWKKLTRRTLEGFRAYFDDEPLGARASIERATRVSSVQQEGPCRPKLIPAAKSVIEALEDRTLDGLGSAESCAICMEGLGSQVTPLACSHSFHRTCIVSWLRTSHTCPLCRFKLPTS